VVRICALYATRVVAQTTPQPQPAPPLERPSREARLALILLPKTLVARLDQHVVGQEVAKRRLALGVSNHFERLIHTWDRGDPDPIVTDPDFHNVRIDILLIGPSAAWLPTWMSRWSSGTPPH
jgi:ATP-dependent protease Clp ATPase subunit